MKGINMSKFDDFKTWCKNQVENRPYETLAIGLTATTVVTKLLDAVAHYRGASAYARQVNRRKR